MSLMGVRRGMTLFKALSGDGIKIDMAAEGVALLISILMLIGVSLIASVFDNLRKLHSEAEQKLQEKREAEAALQASEENLRAILNSIGDAVIATNTEGNIVQMNPIAEQLTGWKLEEAQNKPLTDIFNIVNEKNREAAVNPVKTVLAQGNIVELANHTILISKDSTEFNIADSAAPIKDAIGNITGVVLVFRDITEKMNTEQELFKAKKLESIGLLAGGIAHDFNNILTGLFGNIELAKMKLPQESEAYSYIETAHQALESATSLTKQLLTFAKGGEPILQVINLKDVIITSTKFNMSGSNVKTHFHLPDNLWHVKADKGQISQVTGNLVMNAIQAMPDGGNLYIKAENIHNFEDKSAPYLSGDYVKICIQDEGIGISAKHIKKIFDPYFSTKQTGNGLGLATVHSIIAKHKGYISVESAPAIGTTFTIFLPAQNTYLEAVPPTQLDPTGLPTPAPAHILIMDDEEIIRDVSVNMLESIGYRVDTAVDGREAIEKYSAANKSDNPFDVVIMDLTIPGGMGGKEATKNILEIDPEARIIVSSGYAHDPVMANYAEYGFKNFATKPYTIDQLRDVLSRVLKT